MTGMPTSPDEWRGLAQRLFQQGDLGGASRAFQNSFGKDGPQSAADFLSLARFAIFMATYDQAAEYVERAFALSPGHPDILLTKARIALFRGNRDAARESIEEGLSISPHHPMLLYQALEVLRPVPEDVLGRAAEIAPTQTSPTLLFGVARALDRAGAYEQAWSAAVQANVAQSKQQPGWSRDGAEVRLRGAINLFRTLEPSSPSSELYPVYLTGSPRCGGTLIETVIAAHPDVGSAGERGALLPWLIKAASAFAETGLNAAHNFAAQRDELARADAAGLRSAGIDQAQFTDKTPANAELAGLLRCVHANARFVDIDRDVRDVAVSIFFHEFPDGYPYSTSLNDISDYLDFRRRAIAAWQDAGLSFTRVQYEEFVANPKQEGRRLFEALGLDWAQDLLSPAARSAPARTFSASAVREPINNRKVGTWQRYAEHIQDFDPDEPRSD